MNSIYRSLVFLCCLTLVFCSNSSNNNSETASSQFEWEEASPSSVGLSDELINELSIEAEKLPNIYSFLVVKNGKLITENYYNGMDRNSLLHIRSITKSVSSVLFGIGQKEELFDNMNIKIQEFFPEYINEESIDWLKELTVQHLLDMQSGFDWNENNEAIGWYTSIPDPLNYIFSKEIINEPGTVYNYNSGSVSLLTYILNSRSSSDYEEYANKNLFEKLSIENFSWDKDPKGVTRSDAGLSLRARDCAKLGYLMMNNGIFNGSELISNNWVQQSWSQKINLNSNFGPVENIHYSNLWWSGKYNNKMVYFGLGYGGQLLLCVPEDELIIITNHEFRLNPSQAATHSPQFLNIIFKPLMDSL